MSVVVTIIVSLVMVAVPVPAVFPADIMAVNPCLVVV
jgi:hypothetical protein